MGICVLVRPPPSNLPDRQIVNNQPAPHPFMLGAQPELTQDKRGEGKTTKSQNFIRELLLIKPVRIDVVPGLSYLYHTERFRFEYQDIEEQMLIGVVHREIPHPFCKPLRLGNCCFRFLSPCHGTITSQFYEFFDLMMYFSIGRSYSIESLVVGEHITGTVHPTGMILL